MQSLNDVGLKTASAYSQSDITSVTGTSRLSVPGLLRQGYRLFTGKEILDEKLDVMENPSDSFYGTWRKDLFQSTTGSIVSSNVLFIHPSGNVKIAESVSKGMIPESTYFDVNFKTYAQGGFIPLSEEQYRTLNGKEFSDAERKEFSASGIGDSVSIGQKVPIYESPFWMEIAGNDDRFLRKLNHMVRESEQRPNSHHGSVYLKEPDEKEIRGYFVHIGQVFEGIILDTGISRNLDSYSTAHPILHLGIKPKPTTEIVELKKQPVQNDQPLELRLVA